jgi:hypothetical protein
MDEWMSVLRACFKKTDRGTIRTQAVHHNRSGSATADNHIIKGVFITGHDVFSIP